MEKLYTIRDAFFWWAGVWASVTLGNHAICTALKRRRREKRKREYAQWRLGFAEFLFSEDTRPEGAETDEPEETAEVTEPEAAPEDSEAVNADETAEN